MHQHLTDVKSSVDRALADIQAAGSRAAVDLRSKRDEAHSVMEARRHEVEQANAKMKASLDAKKAEADTTVAEWKARREVERLKHRADRAEEYASSVVVVAWGAFQEANAAILDAVVARADADEAKQGAPAKA
jgi:hypothetical protein